MLRKTQNCYLIMDYLLSHFYNFLACEFKCEADNVCISSSRVCNGYPSCSDGQDEKGCRKTLKYIYLSCYIKTL